MKKIFFLLMLCILFSGCKSESKKLHFFEEIKNESGNEKRYTTFLYGQRKISSVEGTVCKILSNPENKKWIVDVRSVGTNYTQNAAIYLVDGHSKIIKELFRENPVNILGADPDLSFLLVNYVNYENNIRTIVVSIYDLALMEQINESIFIDTFECSEVEFQKYEDGVFYYIVVNEIEHSDMQMLATKSTSHKS